MKEPGAGNDKFVLTEEPVMGIFSRFGSRKPEGKRDRLRRWVMPQGAADDPKLAEIKRAAAADAAEIEAEGRENFRPDGPGNQEDDL